MPPPRGPATSWSPHPTTPCDLIPLPPPSFSKGDASSAWACHKLVVARELAERLAEKAGVELQVLASFPGAVLEGCKYRHPLFERESPVVIGGDYITTETGGWGVGAWL